MRVILLSLLVVLMPIQADARPKRPEQVSCYTIDKKATYQALCTNGYQYDIDCRGYTLVQGLGDIPAKGVPISQAPFFIKTADIEMEELVNCKTFRGIVVKSEKYVPNLISNLNGNEQIIKNTHHNLYNLTGKLFVDFYELEQIDRSDARSRLDMILADTKTYTNGKVLNISKSGTAVFINELTIAEAKFLHQMHGDDLIKFNWSSETQHISLTGK